MAAAVAAVGSRPCIRKCCSVRPSLGSLLLQLLLLLLLLLLQVVA